MRILISFFPLQFLLLLYVGNKFSAALSSVTGLPTASILPSFIIFMVWFSLFPLSVWLLKLLKSRQLPAILSGHYKIVDIIAAPFWIGSILAIEIAPYLLLLDFIKLPLYPLFDQFRAQWYWAENWFVAIFVILYTSYVLIRIVLDTVFIRIRHHETSFKSLPARLDGFKIAHISDTLIDNRCKPRRLRRYVRKLNRLKPDIVFMTGDLISGQDELPGKAAKALGLVKAPYGIFACLGEQDADVGADKIVKQLTKHHIQVGQDINQFVRIGPENLLITFITNHYRYRANLDRLNFLMGQQPRGFLDIAIAHQPSESLVELAAERGYHIFLAGHTLSGQMVLSLLGYKLARSGFETPFYKGSRRIQEMLININGGLGFKLVPFRYRAPGEITLLTLHHST